MGYLDCLEPQLPLIRNVASWSMAFIALMMLLGSFMHLDSTLGGSNWCDDTKALYGDDVKCIGNSLIWKDGDKGCGRDYNLKWRETFTFRPSEFLDTWTPFFYAAAACVQTFGTMKSDQVVGSWGRCLAFYLFGSFWAVFGYAGNWGVFWGFIITLWLCPILLLLCIMDADCQDTQVDLNTYTAMLGLTQPTQPKENNEVRPPPVAQTYEDNNAMSYPVINNEPNQGTGNNDDHYA